MGRVSFGSSPRGYDPCHPAGDALLNEEEGPPIVSRQPLKVTRGHPNPFSGKIQWAITSQKIRDVQVHVYDIRGAQVREWTMSIPTGRSVVEWDARDSNGRSVTSGRYYMKLSDDDGFAVVRDMVVLR